MLRIRYKHKQIPKNLVRRDNSHHLLKYVLGICLCSILIPLLHVSTLLQTGRFPIFSLFWRPFFVAITTVKVKSMPDFYILAIVLINKYKETNEKQLLFFDLLGGGGGGGKKSLLMHVPQSLNYIYELHHDVRQNTGKHFKKLHIISRVI